MFQEQPGPLMEEPESAEQPELLSLIISGEEEATPEESDLGGKGGGSEGRKLSVFFAVALTGALCSCQNHGYCHAACEVSVGDNAVEQHGPCLCGSYKQRLNSTQAEQTGTRCCHPAVSGLIVTRSNRVQY